jgi:hypothetical protein
MTSFVAGNGVSVLVENCKKGKPRRYFNVLVAIARYFQAENWRVFVKVFILSRIFRFDAFAFVVVIEIEKNLKGKFQL